ncbi:mucin-5AC-like [Sipha flava]|uniref:Mucin-5AC-like n=1 Tax=Sipha flava TaxID=143950 RepID=A0A8B8GEZ0_9HEMI|nr:mucin-5AC-like [Sipha flava]
MADLKILVVFFVALFLKNGALSCSLHSHTSTSTSSSVSDSTTHTSVSCGSTSGQCSSNGLNQIASTSLDSTSFPQYNSVPVTSISDPGLPATPLSSSSFNYDELSNNYLPNYLSFPPIPIATPISLPFPSTNSFDSSQPFPSIDSPAHLKPLVLLFMPNSGSSKQWSTDRLIPYPLSNLQQITIPTTINVPGIKPTFVPEEVLSPVPETTTTFAPVSNNIPISAPVITITNSTDISTSSSNIVPTSGSLLQSVTEPALNPESDSINTPVPLV